MFSIAGILGDVRALYYSSLLLLFGVWLITWTTTHSILEKSHYLAPVSFLLIGLLVTGSKYDPPIKHVIGLDPKEQAILILQDKVPSGSNVFSGAPGDVWAARMTFVNPNDSEFNDITDGADFYDALVKMNVKAIYVDHTLTNENEYKWRLIEPHIGQFYETAYMGREGSVRVLLINQP